MKKLFMGLLIALFFAVFIYVKKPLTSHYLVTATANPGKINIYLLEGSVLKKIKSIDTSYAFVYTVRLGDIYNNKQQYIVAGVSNSFFSEPYGCKVIAYDLVQFKPTIIDDVGDLRCKDLAIGDAENNGKNDIVLATHGIGLVRLYRWDGTIWQKEDLEKNYIAQIDEKEGINHKVPNDQLTCNDCIVNTAVHIVKIADVDNDGKNEIIGTMSSPLELQGVNEISFVRIYKKVNGSWQASTVDRLTGREFRSITVGDIYHNRQNVLLIGVGSPRNEPASLFSYQLEGGQWKKKEVYKDGKESNMKAVALIDPKHNGNKQILLATGFPQAKVMFLEWNGKSFDSYVVGTIASLFPATDGQFNSMAVVVDGQSDRVQFFVGGMETFPSKKIGWEGTDKGFMVRYVQDKNNRWAGNIFDKNNILGMDSQ